MVVCDVCMWWFVFTVGDKVPADVRIIKIFSTTLRVDQAILTGNNLHDYNLSCRNVSEKNADNTKNKMFTFHMVPHKCKQNCVKRWLSTSGEWCHVSWGIWGAFITPKGTIQYNHLVYSVATIVLMFKSRAFMNQMCIYVNC